LDDKKMDEILAVLKDIQENERQEMAYAKKQSRIALITSLCSLFIVVIMAVVVLSLFPTLVGLIKNANETVVKVNTMMEDTNAIIDNMEKVTSDLVKLDYADTISNINSLVVEAEESISEAMDKLNKVDFDKLNNAISSLESVVSPLARLFGK